MEMKNVSWRKWLVFGAAAVLLLSLGVFLITADGTEASSVSCGDVITEDTTMTANLRCQTNDPALTVVGPAQLNMNGNTLTCGRRGQEKVQIGIEVSGRGADVSNGTIDGCGDNGVHVAGDGGHTISGLTITDSGDDGFDVDSNGNTLEGNTVTGSPDKGILIDEFTHGNMVINNTVTGNNIGIETDTGATGNQISGNTATGNDFLDLLDDGGTGSCDNNWTDNEFGTSEPEACIN